jgi:hypothetical protein
MEVNIPEEKTLSVGGRRKCPLVDLRSGGAQQHIGRPLIKSSAKVHLVDWHLPSHGQWPCQFNIGRLLPPDKYSTLAFCRLASAPHTHHPRGLNKKGSVSHLRFQFDICAVSFVLLGATSRGGFSFSQRTQNTNPDSIPPLFDPSLRS